MTTVQLWDAHFPTMVHNHRALMEYKRIKTPKRNWLPKIFIIIGASGVGKSTLARAMFPDAYWKTNTKWWDDYDGHSTVIWDEFRGEYRFSDLLVLLDSTPLNVEVKGGHVSYVADTICFTSNYHPCEWYDPVSIKVSWDDSPLHRRIHEFAEIIQLGPLWPRWASPLVAAPPNHPHPDFRLNGEVHPWAPYFNVD